MKLSMLTVKEVIVLSAYRVGWLRVLLAKESPTLITRESYKPYTCSGGVRSRGDRMEEERKGRWRGGDRKGKREVK